ncbi:hypothetical protein [Streptomyces sp. MBT55]|uniref:hypothetical protein n=1 Tax=Streptomyces sp. MBT55 TaxID=1488386 RepID=UPI001912A9EC|nr:hypothetical protein [Streptomyces sp. MBT55]MBK6040835.1 hypothetical protein [Streptomyces sp. MBT55]
MSDDKDPVRVGRFDWERLVLMSVPHPTNFKLLPLAVFMSADGGRVRPGNAGLALFGPHEKTWAKLLRWAVNEGWLVLMERGGARRGAGGTTVKRASVYAASVPQPVWERRMEILGAPPFRAAGFEGSGSDVPDSLKGAPDGSHEPLKGASGGSVPATDSLKGAPSAPFNGSDSSLKGAPGDSLQGSTKGAIGTFEGSDPIHEGSDPGFEGSAQALPHHVVPSRSNSSSTSTTSGAGASTETNTSTEVAVTDGGGVGGSSSFEEITNETQRAQAFVDSLPMPGRQARKQQLEDLPRRVLAAFQRGWSEGGLYRYLDISDVHDVGSAASLYLYRLRDDQLPDNEAPPALEGTDAIVSEWMKLAQELDPNKGVIQGQVLAAKFRAEEAERLLPGRHPLPADGGMWDRAMDRANKRMGYSGPARPNSGWDRMAQTARLGLPPEGADKYQHCGSVNCDPITRYVEKIDEQGLKQDSPCSKCHPAMRF